MTTMTLEEVMMMAEEKGFAREEVEVLEPEESFYGCYEVSFGCEWFCYTWLFDTLDGVSTRYICDEAED